MCEVEVQQDDKTKGSPMKDYPRSQRLEFLIYFEFFLSVQYVREDKIHLQYQQLFHFPAILWNVSHVLITIGRKWRSFR
jgi:hypothetical protein